MFVATRQTISHTKLRFFVVGQQNWRRDPLTLTDAVRGRISTTDDLFTRNLCSEPRISISLAQALGADRARLFDAVTALPLATLCQLGAYAIKGNYPLFKFLN